MRAAGLCGCALLSLLACGVSCRTEKLREVVVISPHSPEIRAEFGHGFEEWYRQEHGERVAVRWIDVGGTGEAIEYVRSRSAAAHKAAGVDIFFGGGDYPFIQLGKQNLLAKHPVPDSLLAAIPARLHGVDIYQQDSLWYGAALSSFGIICNREAAKRNNLELPATWEDLARREYFGWVSSGDPRYSGSIHMMYELLLQAYGWHKGWDIITRMGANVQSFAKSASTAAKEVSTGQAAFGLVIDFYAFIEIQRYGTHRLAFVLPEGQSVITPDGIAVLKQSPDPVLAASFVDYVLGEGQMLWIRKPGLPGGPIRHPLCRFPVDSTLYRADPSTLTVTTNPYDSRAALDYDAKLAGKRRAILGDMIASFVITPHAELKRAWKHVIERGLTPAQYEPSLQIGIGEREALELSAAWRTPEFARKRTELINAWTRRAQQRYRSLDAM